MKNRKFFKYSGSVSAKMCTTSVLPDVVRLRLSDVAVRRLTPEKARLTTKMNVKQAKATAMVLLVLLDRGTTGLRICMPHAQVDMYRLCFGCNKMDLHIDSRSSRQVCG